MANRSETETRPRSFHASPAEALEAPPERLLYLACCTRAPASTSRTSSRWSTPIPTPTATARSCSETPMPNVGDELHHFGWNRCSSACHGPDRSHLIVPGFRSSRIHILNVAADPRRPRIEMVIEPEELAEKTGYSRPHTVHCMPGDNVVVSMLGDRDGGGAGGFACLDARTFEVKGRWENGGATPKLNYDFWYQPRKNVLISSEFGEPNAYESGFDIEDVGAAATGSGCTSGTSRSGGSSRRSTWARPGWSRSRCAGCTTPRPSRASSGRRWPATCSASTARTAASRPSP